MDGMRRKAYDELLDWKRTSDGRSAVLIDGARRVGKSHLARAFAEENYRSYILIDFSDVSEDIKGFFRESRDDMDLFFNRLSFHYGVTLHPRESAIIFDEVQFFPFARQKIKQLVEDRRFDYIETGSLLSIRENCKDILIPSEEHHITLHPMDFEEFLWAMGDETTAPYLRDCLQRRAPLGEAGHRKAMNLFRQYMVVGGMPQAVSAYVSSRDIRKADAVKRDILELYRQDVGRYAGGRRKHVGSIFDSIPSMLSRKEKRFTPGSIRKDSANRDYEEDFLWLEDSMIVNICYNATDPQVGLMMYRDRAALKLYMGDTGLLFTMAMMERRSDDEDFYRDVILDRMNVNEGMFVENVVAQMLRAGGNRLFFYSRPGDDDPGKRTEVDFLVRIDGRISPVEVKSGNRIQHASLDRFVAKFGKRIGKPHVLCTRDLHERDGVLYLPIYMAGFL